MAALINVPDLNSEITTEVFEKFVTENMHYILSVTPHNPIIPNNDEWNDAAYDDVHVKEHVLEVVPATAALIGDMCVSSKEEQEHLEKCIDVISE